MTKAELYTGLSAVCQTFFGRAPVGAELPYAVYTWMHPSNFMADDAVFQKVATVEIQLYATDPDTEATMNNKLDELGISWNSQSSFEVSDGAYLTIYSMEVVEDEKS